MAFKTKRICHKDKLDMFNHNQYEAGINTPTTSKSVDKMKSIFKAKWRQESVHTNTTWALFHKT